MTQPSASPRATPTPLTIAPSIPSIAAIWLRVKPIWRSMPNSPRRAPAWLATPTPIPSSPDRYGDGFQQVSDGEGAVEYRE